MQGMFWHWFLGAPFQDELFEHCLFWLLEFPFRNLCPCHVITICSDVTDVHNPLCCKDHVTVCTVCFWLGITVMMPLQLSCNLNWKLINVQVTLYFKNAFLHRLCPDNSNCFIVVTVGAEIYMTHFVNWTWRMNALRKLERTSYSIY